MGDPSDLPPGTFYVPLPLVDGASNPAVPLSNKDDFSARNVTLYSLVGLFFVTAAGTGAILYDSHPWLGGCAALAGTVGFIVTVVLLLRYHPKTAHALIASIAALVATWAFLGYVIWTKPKEVIVHDPPTAEDIENAAAPLRKELDTKTKELSQARQQLSIQAATDNSAPKPIAPLSDDEKQFRIELRSFVKSTLQTHYDAFFGLANVASGGQVGGPIVPAEIKQRADAAYTLLQDSLRGEFQRSWTELNDSTNTTIDAMNPTNTVALFKAYVNNYNKAVTNFKDYLIIVGSAEDKMNLLPKWSEADAQAKREFQSLITYPRSVTFGLENVGFPAQMMGEVSPYLTHNSSQKQ